MRQLGEMGDFGGHDKFKNKLRLNFFSNVQSVT